MSNDDLKEFGFEPIEDREDDLAEFGFEPIEDREDDLAEFGFEQIDTADTTSKGEAALQGAAQGATLGFADEMLGGVSAGAEALYESTLGDDVDAQLRKQGFTGDLEKQGLEGLLEKYKEYRDVSRQAAEKAAVDQPGSYLAGEIGGGALSATLTGLAGSTGKAAQALRSSKGITPAVSQAMAQSAKIAGLEGAAEGLGRSRAELSEGEFGEAARDVATMGGLSAAVGGITPFAGDIIKRGAKGARGKVRKGLEKVAQLPEGSEVSRIARENPEALVPGRKNIDTIQNLELQGNLQLKQASEYVKDAERALSTDKNISEGTFTDILDKVEKEMNLGGFSEKVAPAIKKEKELLTGVFGEDNYSQKDIRDMIKSINRRIKSYTSEGAPIEQETLKKLRGNLSDFLKKENPNYRQYVEEAADRYNFVEELTDKYGLKKVSRKKTDEEINDAFLNTLDPEDRVDYIKELAVDPAKQKKATDKLSTLIDQEDPDVRKFIEESNLLPDDFAQTAEGRALQNAIEKKGTKFIFGSYVAATAILTGGAATGEYSSGGLGSIGALALGAKLPGAASSLLRREGQLAKLPQKLLDNPKVNNVATYLTNWLRKNKVEPGSPEAKNFFRHLVDTGKLAELEGAAQAGIAKGVSVGEEKSFSNTLRDFSESSPEEIDNLINKLDKTKNEHYTRVLNTAKESSDRRRKALLYGLYQQPAFRRLLDNKSDKD